MWSWKVWKWCKQKQATFVKALPVKRTAMERELEGRRLGEGFGLVLFLMGKF